MKKHKLIVVLLTLGFLLLPLTGHALIGTGLTSRPIGGRVITTPPDMQAVLVCAAQYGPFTLKPVNLAIPGPHYIQFTSKSTPRRNGWFLGMYNAIPNVGTCYNPETGVPLPAHTIGIYGVSR